MTGPLPSDTSLNDFLTGHLSRVSARDLDGFSADLTPDVVVVLPDGRIVEGRDQVVEFHRTWFDDPDWSLTPVLVSTHVGRDHGVGLFRVHCTDLDQEQRPVEFDYLLALHAVNGQDGWRIAFDQNTLIR